MDVLKEKQFPLSHLLADHVICHACRVVDRDKRRAGDGFPCPSCAAPSKGARTYFPFGARTLVDLIQHHFHLPPHAGAGSVLVTAEAHRFVVVVLYVSLVDVLLEHFLWRGLGYQGVPDDVVERVLQDSQFMPSRLDKVFPLVAHETWAAALKAVGSIKGTTATQLASFCRNVAKSRNKLVHQGVPSAVPEGMPAECVKSLPQLLELFVALHNLYLVADERVLGSKPPARS